MENLIEYDKCKCGKNPVTHIEDFDTIISEFGMFDKPYKMFDKPYKMVDIEATCKTCNEKFDFHEDQTTDQNS